MSEILKNKRALFISDAHLGHHDEGIEAEKKSQLQKFLDLLQPGDSLFILGDLFDFWYEYRSVIPREHADVICMLKNCIDRGIHIQYVTGNHDFGVGRYFTEDLKIPVHPGPTVIDWEGEQLYLAHGDGLLRKDRGIRFLKALMQNPLSMGLFRLLHPDIGFYLARACSKFSREARSAPDRKAEYRSFAEGRFSQSVDHVILGHTHRPDEWHVGRNTYVNTGDWMTHFTYAKLENHKLRLHYWLEEEGRAPRT